MNIEDFEALAICLSISDIITFNFKYIVNYRSKVGGSKIFI